MNKNIWIILVILAAILVVGGIVFFQSWQCGKTFGSYSYAWGLGLYRESYHIVLGYNRELDCVSLPFCKTIQRVPGCTSIPFCKTVKGKEGVGNAMEPDSGGYEVSCVYSPFSKEKTLEELFYDR